MRVCVVLPFIAFVGVTLFDTACSSSDVTGNNPVDSSAIVTQVTLAPTTASIAIGDTARFTATAKNKDGAAVDTATVSWSSSAAGVATVTNGLVTGVAAGSATITAASNGKSATATVTVTDPATIVTQVTLAPTSLAMTVGDTARLTATPKNSTGGTVASATVTWTSSAPAVATVTSGLVTAVSAGSATITAASNGKSATATVTVAASNTNTFQEIGVATDASLDEQTNGIATDGTDYLISLQARPSGGQSKVGWVLVSATGTIVAGPTYLSGPVGDPPRVGFGGGQYLMTWNDFSQSPSRIMGQFITTSGVASGSAFVIGSHTNGFEDNGGVAYGGGTFLVNYVGPTATNAGVYARTVSTTGALGTEQMLDTASRIKIGFSNSAFDGANFLVGWATSSTVKAQLIAPSGALGTTVDDVATATGHFDDLVSVGFNGTNYMVTFNDAVGTGDSPLDIASAQIISPAPVLVGPEITIAGSSAVGSLVTNVFGSGSNFVVSYLDSVGTATTSLLPFKSKAKFISNTGAAVGDPVVLASVSSGTYPIGFVVGGTGADFVGAVDRATPPATNPSVDFSTFTGWNVYLLLAHIPAP